MDAVIQFKRAFYDLYGTPRIQEPLWLNMSTFPHRRSEYGQMLFKELAYLIGEHNTESRHHFISTLVTAVLTFHLSWVHTVVPPGDFKVYMCVHTIQIKSLTGKHKRISIVGMAIMIHYGPS